MVTAARSPVGVTLRGCIIGGVVGGVAGRLVFGAILAVTGMMPMVASVVGSQPVIVGFLYHMFNSVIIGAAFGLVFGAFSHTYGQGAIFGVIWWVLGPMILMPLGMGLQFAAFTPPMLMSLTGHLAYGKR